ncbi:MAG: ArsC/Spx/MgsR family protein [Actinomycetota bacterium]
MAALDVLQNAEVDHDVVLYMKEKPGRDVISALVAKLEDDPSDLVRRDKFFKDTVVAKNGFDEATLADPEVVIDLLVEHPRLLQRPVVVKGKTAIIGRPRDRVPALIGS